MRTNLPIGLLLGAAKQQGRDDAAGRSDRESDVHKGVVVDAHVRIVVA